MLIYQFTKNKLMPSDPMDKETLDQYLNVKNDYVNKAGIVYNKNGQKICEIDTHSFVEKPTPLMHTKVYVHGESIKELCRNLGIPEYTENLTPTEISDLSFFHFRQYLKDNWESIHENIYEGE